MRLPFISYKKQVIVRNTDGTFSGSVSVPCPAAAPVLKPTTEARQINQTLNQEVQTFGTLAGAMDSLDQLLERRDSRLAAMIPKSEPEEMSWFGEVVNSPVAEMVAPVLINYLPSILERMGFKATPPSPAAPPEEHNAVITAEGNAEAAHGVDFKGLLKQAAETSPKLLKVSMPVINAELKERGIEPGIFKKAILNLSKAV